jgi:hypothetical protein
MSDRLRSTPPEEFSPVKLVARSGKTCSNAGLKVDRDAARRYMIQWIAERAVHLYRRKHAGQS